ncbi:Nramp family divalent metal transporter [Thermithiobacillus plumbiphilus]|uniref:Divalent metal cation transporter MntH n=1 Tax=Thermithiobacillus plumbiphilus TaxID=1729899 RepID=A0ABU9D4I3_9PROT
MALSGSTVQTPLSLDQVHRSVDVHLQPSRWRRFMAYSGPALLISIGYMDPGNWATDLEGGAKFGYQLLWVLVMANWMAILLQSLSARLGIVTGQDLAQACREGFPRPVALGLWALAEIAIIAMDLAEVLGTAIALNLLFKIPLLWGVLITGLDVLLFLALQRYGIRRLEAFILTLVATIWACFLIELFLIRPDWGNVATGLIPRIDASSLYVAIAILGATVMPHNLYLHSSLVQTRRLGDTPQAKRQAIRYNLLDTTISLNLALLVNASILIVAAAVFFTRGIEVTEIAQAQQLLAPLLGTTLASIAFGLALLCAGQSSTITGTLAGQIVMEGMLRVRLSPVLRRLMTRGLAILPAVAVIWTFGEQASLQLLILSQVILSLQLPFAIVPLIRFTSDPQRMGQFVSGPWLKSAAWAVALVVTGLNLWLVLRTAGEWTLRLGADWIWWAMLAPASMAVLLLGWISFMPLGQMVQARLRLKGS